MFLRLLTYCELTERKTSSFPASTSPQSPARYLSTLDSFGTPFYGFAPPAMATEHPSEKTIPPPEKKAPLLKVVTL